MTRTLRYRVSARRAVVTCALLMVGEILPFDACMAASSTPADPVSVVVRRNDRRAIIVVFSGQPAGPALNGAILLNYGAGPAQLTRVVAPAQCPGIAHGMRVCLELPEGMTLDDATPYAISFAPFTVDAKAVGPLIVPVPVVGGSVRLPDAEGSQAVVVPYSLDLSTDVNIDPDIEIGGKHVLASTNTRGGGNGPMCYSTTSFRFDCAITKGLGNGDTVIVRIVKRGTVVPAAGYLDPEPATAKYAVTTDATKYRFELKGSYSHADKETWSGSLQIKNWQWLEKTGYHSSVILRAGPYVDVTASSDTSDHGSHNYGAQATLRFLNLMPLNAITLADNARLESDTKKTVKNFMFLDLTVSPELPFVSATQLPGNGQLRLLPFVGFEMGSTRSDEKTIRIEANDPRRLKVGMGASARWPAELLSVPAGLPFAGLETEFSLTRYRLRLSDSAIAAGRSGSPTAIAGGVTYKVNSITGVTFGWRSGQIAPMFEGTSVTTLGASIAF